MLAIIFTIIFAITVAYFATQNTIAVMINAPGYSHAVPIYLVVLLSLLVGFIFAWILHLMNGIASIFAFRGKDNAIRKGEKTNTELTNKVHNLEIQNAKLETEKKTQTSR
jgi:uncharacterized integral membrane protein